MTDWPHPRLELHDPEGMLGEVPAAVAQALDGLPSVTVHLHHHPLGSAVSYGTVGRIEVFDRDLPESLQQQVVPVVKDTHWFVRLDELGLLPPDPEWRALIGDKPMKKSERESPFLRGGSGVVMVDGKPLGEVEDIDINITTMDDSKGTNWVNPNWSASALESAFRPKS